MKPLQWMRMVRDDPDVPAPARAVAWAVALRADLHGHCWPSYTALAADVGMHRSTVIRHLTWLVDSGWLHRVRRTSAGKRLTSNSYQLLMPVDKPAGSRTGRPPVVAQDDHGSRTGRLPGSRTERQGREEKEEESQTEAAAPPPAPHRGGAADPHLANVVNILASGMRLP